MSKIAKESIEKNNRKVEEEDTSSMLKTLCFESWDSDEYERT